MKGKKQDILSSIGRESGFKVPENFFEDFAARMEKELPKHEVIPEVRPTRWNKIRPYIYMTAMFAGIWCMMWIFNDIMGVGSNTMNPSLVAGFQSEENLTELMMHGDISEFDIYNFEELTVDDECCDINE